MGYNQESLTIHAYLSSHNDERDERDEALWAELRERIGTLLSEARYEDIRPAAD